MSGTVKILIVDDDIEMLEVYSRLLVSEGHIVLTASTGSQGLEMAKQQRPDLILMDVMLPDINGIELCKRIKTDPELAQIFIIHVSGHQTSSDHYSEGLEAGADGYLTKPVQVDSLSALERVSTVKGFREFVISLTSFIKHLEIAGLFNATTTSLMGGSSITETHISTITDSIILLRYVEIFGEMRRGLTVLKMRGSMHNKDIREFTIDNEGMHIGDAFRNVVGILAGHPQHLTPAEMDRLGDLFSE